MKRKRKGSAGSFKKSAEKLVEEILAGERAALAQAITLVESNAEHHFETAQHILTKLLPHSGSSVRIGITGVPGAGKSTFIDSFGTYLCNEGRRVAVLAVDPSSKVTGGSILGDKTRMERLSKNPHAFIRPSPASGTLGGVARKTRETIILCEAAGFDWILVETVGVGQGEFVVREMVDFFMLLVLTGAGDELQTMKKGIMELPDLVVVNKADGNNLERAKAAIHEYQSILHFLKPYTAGWETTAVPASALYEKGIKEIAQSVQDFIEETENSGILQERRTSQQKEWLHEMIKEQLHYMFMKDEHISKLLPRYEQKVLSGDQSVSLSVRELMNLFFSKRKQL
ncbi:methylmalonyl Co-A mutase-associated GTPase MeaB [Bacillus lacus]|uniref:Methylmalonyl Co-A mutase-associated GTPase MeaB n=1 Tax=Metabacillus lacus TaxID=1983721 RepID=A0A7X2J0E9_9BACI|nr:methylmalonyl Co-A mutase-associated GTPase MeaB [Metabacillus lacus]MRX73140.1 methylmalonyl Co-A mutase-associated GTPase MeaB [Metabacillus lacus]